MTLLVELTGQIPTNQTITGVKFNNNQVFATASVVQPGPQQNISGAKFDNSQVFFTASVGAPPPPPYRVNIGTITGAGTANIDPDPNNPTQDLLDINFISGGGGGGDIGVNVLDFNGADLGAKANNALAAGNLDLFVPNSNGLTVTTPIRVRHSMSLRLSSRWPQSILCKTGNLPVFEATDPNIRNFNIDGGFFEGSPTQTPSCLLLEGSNSSGTQQGDGKPLSNVRAQGQWGTGVINHIGAEVAVYDHCLIAMQGKGDSPFSGPRHTVRIGNADYWNVPWAYTKPNVNARSTSAIVFQNCTVGYDVHDNGSGFLIKGQVEDVTINAVYLNSTGRCHVLSEMGDPPNTGPTFPRRINILGGGRSENNDGTVWAGCPLVIVDGFDQGFGINLLTIGPMGIFVGNGGGTVPVIQAVRGGQIYNLTVQRGIFVEGTDTLLDHAVADLVNADIRCPLPLKIKCPGRSIVNSYIETIGDITGTVNPNSRIRSNNFNNW